MNISFLLFYSPKPRCQVWILRYRNWSILRGTFVHYWALLRLKECYCWFISFNWVEKKDKKSLINNLLSWFSCRSSTLVQGIYIGTWRCSSFVEGVRSEYPEKGLWAGRGPIARSTHIWCWAGIEPWRHLWEAIALISAPSSLPVVAINNGCPVNFSHGMMTLCVLEWDCQDCSRGCYINNRLSQFVELEMSSNGQEWTSRSYKIWKVCLSSKTFVVKEIVY